jgi:hypothetical protein
MGAKVQISYYMASLGIKKASHIVPLKERGYHVGGNIRRGKPSYLAADTRAFLLNS